MKTITATIKKLIPERKYAIGKTYRTKNPLKNGFVASAQFDVSDIIIDSFSERTKFIVVDANVVEKKSNLVICNEIKVLNILSSVEDVVIFDKRGKYLMYAGIYFRSFDYEKWLKFFINKYISNEWSGEYLCESGYYWKEFDYEKVFYIFEKYDNSGVWIFCAGEKWKKFDYDKGLDLLIKKDRTGRWIYYAGLIWKEFNYDKGFEALKKTNNDLYEKALKDWNVEIIKQ